MHGSFRALCTQASLTLSLPSPQPCTTHNQSTNWTTVWHRRQSGCSCKACQTQLPAGAAQSLTQSTAPSHHSNHHQPHFLNRASLLRAPSGSLWTHQQSRPISSSTLRSVHHTYGINTCFCMYFTRPPLLQPEPRPIHGACPDLDFPSTIPSGLCSTAAS